MRETQFVTFYSYKGGVGRTMALGNIAWEAALRGKRVVIIDFDLEAPGIPSLIPFRDRVEDHLKDKSRKGGLFELILYFQKHKLVPSIPDFYSTEPIIDDDFEVGGEIYIVPAGYEDSNYKDKLQSFDWDKFYEQEDGAELFAGLRDEIKFQFDNPDLVLIDSRTGLTDIGGICTLLIPDKVVVLTGLNDQNIRGCKAVIDTIDKHSFYRMEENYLNPISIILVVSHVPDGEEVDLLDRKLEKAKMEFNRPIDVVFPYVPILSLEERLFIQLWGRKDTRSMTLVDRYRMLYSLVEDLQSDMSIFSLLPVLLPIPGMSNVLFGKYPVTVYEYRIFVEGGGYHDELFWKEGWVIKQKWGWEEPAVWDEQLEHLSRPVTGVSWYEAVAYCNWLAARTELSYRLPKSDEWEKAANNPVGKYPWGDDKPNSALLNYNENVGAPTPVCNYPSGVAPGGYFDMAGNVWEWNWDTIGESELYRVIRGGSWFNKENDCRSEIRFRMKPDSRYNYLGFRICRSDDSKQT